MPRTPRLEFAGAIHHVTARTPSGRLLYRDDYDRELYLRLLGEQAIALAWQVLSYCQMTNHVHLLVRTPEPNLSCGMQAAHSAFASYFNRKYDENGHLFGRRYSSKSVLTDAHLRGCFRYIARNPVEAGICAAPGDWPWSAHAALLGGVDPTEFLDVAGALEFFGPKRGEAQDAYRELTSTDERDLLADLRTPGSWEWLLTAVDDFHVGIGALAAHLGVTTRTVYTRIARERRAASLRGQTPQ